MYDSGASHSFIAYNCVRRLGLSVHKFPYDLVVSTPTGVKVVTADGCLSCVINAEGHESIVDLICLPLQGLEVILDIDWLTANSVLLDCKRKRVIYPNLQFNTSTEINLNFLLVAEAERCLYKGC